MTDDQRRRLAAKGKELGRKSLAELGSMVTPDTIPRRHRESIATRYDGSRKRGPGRRSKATEIRDLVVRLATERRTAVRECVAHYREQSNHDGLGSRLITQPANDNAAGAIECRERLGGLLRFYYGDAA